MAKNKTKAKAKPAKAAKPEGYTFGRPTEYGPHVLAITKDYYAGGYKADGHTLPLQAGLCMRLDIGKGTLREWAARHPDFSALLDNGRVILEMAITNGGTGGLLNPTFTALVAANTIDWRSSKADIDHKSSDGTMSPTKIAIVAG